MAGELHEMHKFLICYYPLKNSLKDASKKNPDLKGLCFFAPGRYGRATYPRDDEFHLFFPQLHHGPDLSEATISFWIKLDKKGNGTTRILSQEKLRIILKVTPDNRVIYYTYLNCFDGICDYEVKSSPLKADVWHHIAISIRYQDAIKLYVNGRLKKSISIYQTIIGVNGAKGIPLAFNLGGGREYTDPLPNKGPNYSYKIHCAFGDISMFSRALNQHEINILAGVIAFRPPLKIATKDFNNGPMAPPIIAVGALVAFVAMVITGTTYYLFNKKDDTTEWSSELDPAAKEISDHSEPRMATGEIVKKILSIVGIPAKEGVYVSKEDIGLDETDWIRLDIGGEGYHSVGNVERGFADAININERTTDSQPPHEEIPNLVQVQKWASNPSYPFADGFADCINMQNAPLTDKNVKEIARCLRPGGEVGLWIDAKIFDKGIKQLAELLKTDAEYDVHDEFDGKALYKKIRIVSKIQHLDDPSPVNSRRNDGNAAHIGRGMLHMPNSSTREDNDNNALVPTSTKLTM